ncbi:MAG: LCP family protein [Clostridia bacterium]|nr:LCP family protein [Clostridia bacterium]
MNNKRGQKQVSLAGVANTTTKPMKKKKPFPWVGLVVTVVVIALVVTACLTLFREEKGPALSAREMVEYTVTPDSVNGKVSYYALAVTGEKATDRLDMVAVLCCDWKNKSAGVLQVPVATYIGKDTGFAVSAIGDVWGKPQPETFCSTCRIRLEEKDIAEGTHKTCGSATEQRTGSAYGDLIRVFNDQYGLPIDNFLVIPRAGLAQMIDLLGGVNVKLNEGMMLADVNYESGVQLLPGDAAVDYAITDDYAGTPDSDVNTRMARQRQLFAAILQGISTCEADELYSVDKTTGATKGVFGKLMLGENPLRFNTTSFGKARLLNISEGAANDLKLSAAIAKFAQKLSGISLDKITFSTLPGTTAKDGTATYYSVDTAAAAQLLGEQMNPYQLTVEVTAPTLTQSAAAHGANTVVLDSIAAIADGDKED